MQWQVCPKRTRNYIAECDWSLHQDCLYMQGRMMHGMGCVADMLQELCLD